MVPALPPVPSGPGSAPSAPIARSVHSSGSVAAQHPLGQGELGPAGDVVGDLPVGARGEGDGGAGGGRVQHGPVEVDAGQVAVDAGGEARRLRDTDLVPGGVTVAGGPPLPGRGAVSGGVAEGEVGAQFTGLLALRVDLGRAVGRDRPLLVDGERGRDQLGRRLVDDRAGDRGEHADIDAEAGPAAGIIGHRDRLLGDAVGADGVPPVLLDHLVARLLPLGDGEGGALGPVVDEGEADRAGAVAGGGLRRGDGDAWVLRGGVEGPAGRRVGARPVLRLDLLDHGDGRGAGREGQAAQGGTGTGTGEVGLLEVVGGGDVVTAVLLGAGDRGQVVGGVPRGTGAHAHGKDTRALVLERVGRGDATLQLTEPGHGPGGAAGRTAGDRVVGGHAVGDDHGHVVLRGRRGLLVQRAVPVGRAVSGGIGPARVGLLEGSRVGEGGDGDQTGSVGAGQGGESTRRS